MLIHFRIEGWPALTDLTLTPLKARGRPITLLDHWPWLSLIWAGRVCLKDSSSSAFTSRDQQVDASWDWRKIPWRLIQTKSQWGLIVGSRHPQLYLSSQSTSSDTAEVTLGWLPFSHIYGLMVLLVRGLYVRYTIVVMAKYTPRAFLEAIATHRVSTCITI